MALTQWIIVNKDETEVVAGPFWSMADATRAQRSLNAKANRTIFHMVTISTEV